MRTQNVSRGERAILIWLAAGIVGFIATERSSAQAAANAVSYWDHNGSVVSLTANGATRRFYYEMPRAGLEAIGVKPGTLLFRGRKEGDTYSGTAFIFAPNCPPTPYEVSGTVSAGDRQVTMYGQAPRVGAGCRITGYRSDTLIFAFERTVSDQNAGYRSSAPNAPVARPARNEPSPVCQQYLRAIESCLQRAPTAEIRSKLVELRASVVEMAQTGGSLATSVCEIDLPSWGNCLGMVR